MKNTELNLIPIFVAIYEEKSLSKAAVRLDISQPAVSKALARLRDMYDEPLFHRNSSGVDPTAFASDIYPALSAAYKNFSSTLVASRDFDPRVSNRVFSIACISSSGYWLLPEVAKQIRAIAPNISLEVHPLFTEDFEMDLRLQRYDLIIDMEVKSRASLKAELLYEEKLVMVCAEDHPRIKDSITVDDFFNEQHVAVSKWESRRSLLSIDDTPDIDRRNIAYRAPGVIEMLPAISNSDLIGLLPESVVQMFGKHYRIKSLDNPVSDKHYGLYTIWHPSRTNESGHIWLRNQIKLVSKTLKNMR